MNESEITALTREYAEENVKQPEDMSNSLHNEYLKLFAHEAEELIRFLLRRYCLVDKSKVKNIHNGILVQLDPKNFGYSPYNQGRMDVIKSLFPDLGKEVEE